MILSPTQFLGKVTDTVKIPISRFALEHQRSNKQVKESLPSHLQEKMSESVGHSIGIEVKESMSLKPKSNNVVVSGMVLHLRIAIKDDDYCILLGDTVIVKDNVDERTGNYGRSVTKFKYDWSNVAYDMNEGGSSSEEDDEEDIPKNMSKEDAEALREAKKITGGRTCSVRAVM